MFNHAQNIVFAQNLHCIRRVRKRNIQRRIHLHAADRRQVIAVFVKEQHLKDIFRRFQRNRLARTHNLKDIGQRFFAVGVAVAFQRVADIRPDIDIVNIEQIQLFNFRRIDFLKQFFVEFRPGVGDNFARLGDNQRFGKEFAIQVFVADHKALQPAVNQFLRRTHRQFLIFVPDFFVGVGINQIKAEFHAFDPLRHKCDLPAFFTFFQMVNVIEISQNFLFAHTGNFRRI